MLRIALVWLVSLNIAWSAAAHAAAAALGARRGAAASPPATCERPADYALLAAQPPTTVLAISNLGSPILVRTAHRVLAGPYHRNIAGNLLTLEAFMGTAEQARTVIDDNRIGLVAVCRGNAETPLLTEPAPAMASSAALTRGRAAGLAREAAAARRRTARNLPRPAADVSHGCSGAGNRQPFSDPLPIDNRLRRRSDRPPKPNGPFTP